jgi:hypothetical protein
MSATTQEVSQLIPGGEGGPYKFLDYFEEKDESTFAGRDRDIKEIVARIMVDRTVVLYGRSGLGKTSLVLAGLFPELRRRDLLPVYCRVLQNPRTDVEESLYEALGLAGPRHLLETLRERKVVLVLDQFEEFFVRFDKSPDARQAMVDLLKELLEDSKSSLRVLISLREDYLARLDELKEQVPEFFLTDYRLGQLTAFGARQAITRPLIQKGIHYEPKLVSQILEIISSEDFDSLLLQLICTAVASEACRCGRPGDLLAEDLKAVGGLDGILGRYLDAATKEIPDYLRLLTRTLLDALITSENTKRAVTFSLLQQWDAEAKLEELTGALEFLRRKRLVREERRGNSLWYELTHERLVNPILRWFELDRTFADFRFAREMVVNGSRSEMYRTRPEAFLPRETLDNLIGPFRDRLRLDTKQMEFLFWSAVYRRSDEAEFWAERLTPETCGSILMELLKRPDLAARAGAAHFAFLIPDAAAAEECLRLSLTDPVREVRQEAGQTLARIAGAPQISALKSALGRRRTRRRALEALACFPEGSKSFRLFGWYSRRLARRIARQRLFAASGHLRGRHMKAGALSGLISSIIWVFTFFPSIICLVAWNAGTAEYFPLLDPSIVSELGVIVGWGFPIVILVSVLLGVAVGRGTARVAVLDKPYAWWRAWLYLFLISGTVLAVLILLANRNGDGTELIILIRNAWAISFVVSVAAIFHIRFGSAGMLKFQASTIKRWVIGFLHSTTPFTICGTIGLIASVSVGDRGDWFGAGLFAGGLWSVVFYAWSTSFVESALPDAANLRDRLRLIGGRLSGPASVAAVAAAAIAYLLAFGPTSIPIFAENAKVDAAGITAEPHSLSLHRVPNAVFLKVELPRNAPRVYETSGLPDDVNVQFGNSDGHRYFYLPPGRWLGNVSHQNFKGGWVGKRINLSFRPVPALDGRIVPATDEYQGALLTLQKDTSKDPPEWIAEINGQILPIGGALLEIVPLVQPLEISAVTGNLTASGSGLRNYSAPRIPLIDSNPHVLSRPNYAPADTGKSLSASVAGGNVPFGLSDNSVPWQDEHASWAIPSDGGAVRVNLRLTFSMSGPTDPRKTTTPRYSKDEIVRLPSQLVIAVALRTIRPSDR